MCRAIRTATSAISPIFTCSVELLQRCSCDAIATPETISTPKAIAVPIQNRRAAARSASRSPAARRTGTTTAASISCPPTKNAIATRCSQSTPFQSVTAPDPGTLARSMNFARDVVDAAPPKRTAIIEIAHDGRRREWTFAEVADRSARLAGVFATTHAIRPGDVVMTLIGNRPEWVLSMVACFRIGAAALACNEQLRSKDLAHRLAAAGPSLIVADERNLSELSAANPACPVLAVPDARLLGPNAQAAPAAELEPHDPCLITFTSGTTGEPRGVVHGQRYLPGQRLQAEHWLDARPGDLVWCTAASGWSKSARNVFIAPWLRGAAALLHDERFDPLQRLEILAAARVAVLGMART